MANVGGIIAAQRMRSERAMVQTLRAAEAFAPDRAVALPPQQNLGRLALRGLLHQTAIRQTAPGLYYLDEPVYAAVRTARRRLLVGLAVLVLVFGIAFALGT
jgi:hypothetical protein